MSAKAQKASGLEHVECKGRKDDAREKRGSDRCQLKRTRGHLPNPNVLDGESKLLTFRTTRTCSASVDTPGTCMPTPTNKRRMEMVQTASSQITVAIRFEQITENDTHALSNPIYKYAYTYIKMSIQIASSEEINPSP